MKTVENESTAQAQRFFEYIQDKLPSMKLYIGKNRRGLFIENLTDHDYFLTITYYDIPGKYHIVATCKRTSAQQKMVDIGRTEVMNSLRNLMLMGF